MVGRGREGEENARTRQNSRDLPRGTEGGTEALRADYLVRQRGWRRGRICCVPYCFV